jgi:16S rRNA G966 N2-methylase RsmD
MKTKIIKMLIRRLEVYNDKECISGTIMQNLLQDGAYLPITSSSPSLTSLQLLMNDVIINNRKNILEFGSGISTIIFSRLLHKNKIDGKVLSIDNDSKWIEIIKNILEKEGLTDYVEFIHAPLIKNKHLKSLDSLSWYNVEILSNYIKDDKFDLVFVDGPIAYKESIQFSRYPALPFIYNNLKSNFSFFLDDCNRKGEKKILSLCEKEYKIKFRIINQNLGFSSKGNSYNIF